MPWEWLHLSDTLEGLGELCAAAETPKGQNPVCFSMRHLSSLSESHPEFVSQTNVLLIQIQKKIIDSV